MSETGELDDFLQEASLDIDSHEDCTDSASSGSTQKDRHADLLVLQAGGYSASDADLNWLPIHYAAKYNSNPLVLSALLKFEAEAQLSYEADSIHLTACQLAANYI